MLPLNITRRCGRQLGETSPWYPLLETLVRALLFLFTALGSAACSSSVAGPSGRPEPNAGPSIALGCYALQLGGPPSPDVQLPSLIQLSSAPAPGFTEPGRFAVLEPGVGVRQAPISWWLPREDGGLELVLGGGYTGYTFTLRAQGADWIGEGMYYADFGVLPAPPALPARLTRTTCR